MPPPGRSWLSGLLSKRRAGRVVVGVDEEPAFGVDDVRHLGGRQDLVRHGLAGLRRGPRQPLVAARAVADEPRRGPVDGAGLQVFSQRHLGTGEVGEVAPVVGVCPVLRADVEELQSPCGSRRDPWHGSRWRNASSSRVALEPGVLHADSALPAVADGGVRATIGPLLRRGTIERGGGDLRARRYDDVARPGPGC